MEETLKQKIADLETKKSDLEQSLSQQSEEKAALAADAKVQQKQVDEFNKKIKKNKDFFKHELRKFEKDFKEWEKKRDEVAGQIKEINDKKGPLFYQLGKLIDDERVEHEELQIFYSKLDKTKTRTQELEDKIKDLEP
jgi:chromosome segregation ATPase